MNDIHAPNVPSGPASGDAPRDLSNLSMPDLMQEKERIEDELSALSSVLQSHGVRTTSSLTTFDGFPRDDIDVAQVRATRVRMIHLRNDHKAIMGYLEKGLHAHFAQSISDEPTTNGTSEPSVVQSLPSPPVPGTSVAGRPFAKVNTVVPESPADQAGLKAGDQIRSFGAVNWLNHERLTKVAEIVQQNEARAVSVQVSRNSDNGTVIDLDLQLIPRQNWGGRGLLGCHLVPL